MTRSRLLWRITGAAKVPAALLALCLVATGCATGYHEAGNPLREFFQMEGGYSERPGPGELIKVSFHGNKFIAPEKMEIYLLYRCAEIAMREHKPFFGFYRDLPRAITGETAMTKRTTQTMNSPYLFAYILPSATKESGFMDAAEVLRRYGSEVGGKATQ